MAFITHFQKNNPLINAHQLTAWVLLFVFLGVAGCSEPTIVSKNKDSKAADGAKPAAQAEAKKPFNALYNFEAWEKESVRQSSPSASSALSAFAVRPTKTKSVLDYYGESATAYELHGKKLEYFKVIDSAQLLEINWLRPSKKDIPESKVVSSENTHKVYTFVRGLMGEEGGELIKTMVDGTGAAKSANVGKETVGGKRILVARCDFFDCSLIFKK